ncbi:MAG: hypothetical protein ABIT38_20360 [Gemmatimonadaceae bacterium]
MRSRVRRRRLPVSGACLALLLVAAASLPSALKAQWSTTYESFYLPGSFNWQFRQNYPAADRLFNAFDYGHAILYERLWREPGAPASRLEEKEYDFITRELLVHPPALPLEEAAIEVAYAKLAPEAKAMFDWAHLFHRQVYDVWADERIALADKDARVAELLRFYKSRPDLAFSSSPKTMELMEGQPYSLAFRTNYPKFNGLIWAYHWLQVGLYEPLVVGKDKDERQTGVLAAVARFRQMIERAPTNMPRIMPMTAAVAPTFAARYPEASIIFDNLHSMHDVVSDILANPKVPRSRKREEILLAARRYRDATSYVQTRAEWLEMAEMMGVENMGGPAVHFLAGFPTPTVERGAVMAAMDHSKMQMSTIRDSSGAAHPSMDHSKMSMDDSSKVSASSREKPMDHSAMDHSAMSHARADSATNASDSAASSNAMMQALHMRMMADPIIRARILSDSGTNAPITSKTLASSKASMKVMGIAQTSQTNFRPRHSERIAGSREACWHRSPLHRWVSQPPRRTTY